MRRVWRVLWRMALFLWWVIRLGGVAGDVRDTYQVIIYLAAYGPPFLVASILNTTLDFAAEMPVLLRLAFFIGVFFCTLAITGGVIAFVVWVVSRRKDKPEMQTPSPGPASADVEPGSETASDPELSAQEIAERRIANRSVRILDLLRVAGSDDDTIDGWTFETCTILGPGIITNVPAPRPPEKGRGNIGRGEVWQHNTCHVKGNPESVFHEVPSGGGTADGVIHLVGCTYRRVTFSGIGIAGSAEELKGWWEKVSFSSSGNGVPAFLSNGSSAQESKAEVERLQEENSQLRTTANSYVDTFHKREEAHQNRLALIHELRQLWEEGQRLPQGDRARYDIEDWEARSSKLIEMALGVQKRRDFAQHDPEYARWSDDVDENDPEEQVRIRMLLDRLGDLIRQVNSYAPYTELRSNFDIREYRKWLDIR